MKYWLQLVSYHSDPQNFQVIQKQIYPHLVMGYFITSIAFACHEWKVNYKHWRILYAPEGNVNYQIKCPSGSDNSNMTRKTE